MSDLGVYGKIFDELGIPRNVAAGYVESFKDKVFVVKGGGEVIKDDCTTAYDLVAMYKLGIKPLFVHGGKDRIEKRLKDNNIESEFVGGYRVTTPEMIEIIEEALDEVSLEFCRKVEGLGMFPFSFKGLTYATKHENVNRRDLGLVGDPQSLSIEREGIIAMLNESILVTSPISIASDGNGGAIYNTNADAAASCIAGKMDADKLIYLTDVDGVEINNGLMHELKSNDADGFIGSGQISGGMIPKVKYAIKGKKAGVNEVHIINGKTPHALLMEIFSDAGIGTMID